MSKILVLAEKPSVARDIARVLKCNKKGNGYIEGNNYIITWALGHLVTLTDPEGYNNKYKQWRIEDIPIVPEKFKYSIIKQTSKQFNAVKSQLERNDVSEVVIATDAGREGELVARLILYKTGCKKPIKRLWISSVTDKAIKEGFSKLRDGREYNNLYASALCRAEADWVVGINATRALTCKYNAQLSCGRVQTPTLAMVYEREKEIREFKPKEFYSIDIKSKNIKFTWFDKTSNSNRTFNEEKVDKILNKIKGQNLLIVDVEKKIKKSYPSGLYDLTSLQRDANRIWNYSAKETLSIMQRLYEHYKVLTYPRTDSKYISNDIVPTLKDRVKAARDINKAAAKDILLSDIKANKSFVDNAKVSDHHAIIPTEESPILSDFTQKERNIYELVVKRFLAVLMKPYEYEEVTIKGEINSEEFRAKGKKIISMGWKDVYTEVEEDEDNQIVGGINKNDTLKVDSFNKKLGKTTPPDFFNEGTLLSAMENPLKYTKTNDAKINKTLGETGGIGTVATRADIIEKLFSNFLIEKRGKDIITTSKGRQLLDLAPKELTSPKLTGEWELKLQQISKGKLNKDVFMKDIIKYTEELVEDIKLSEEKFRHDNLSGENCPQCGKKMLSVNTKKGRALVCQDRECGYRKNVAILTNVRCPECKKKLELRGSGDGKIYACLNKNCNFREKESVFKQRFNKNNKVNKKEVNKIMQKMKKEAEESINNPFAELLKDFNK